MNTLPFSFLSTSPNYMQEKEYYFLSDAIQLIKEKTNQIYTENDLFSCAIEGKLFLFISVASWQVKVYNTNTEFDYTGNVPADIPTIKKAVKNYRECQKQTFVNDFLVASNELLQYGITDPSEHILLQSIKNDSCPFSPVDLVIKALDLLDFIKQHCPILPAKTPINDTTIEKKTTLMTESELIAISNTSNRAKENIFRKNKTETWSVQFEDSKLFTMPSYAGFNYIRHLLMNPNKPINTLELHAIFASPIKPRSQPEIGEIIDENLTTKDSMHSYEQVIDEAALEQYRKKTLELQEQIKEAHEFEKFDKAEKLEDELKFLVAEIQNSITSTGKLKSKNNNEKKIKDSVTRNIRNAISKFKQYPDFETHLSSTIKTGKNCTYTPKTEIFWIFD